MPLTADTEDTDLVTRITWSNLNLDAGKNFVTTIEDVRIIEDNARIVAVKGAPEFTTSLAAVLGGTARAFGRKPQTLYHGYNGQRR